MTQELDWPGLQIARADLASLQPLPLTEATKQFLCRSGLPAELQGVQYLAIETGIIPVEQLTNPERNLVDEATEANRYFVIGMGNDKIQHICIDAHTGSVIVISDPTLRFYANADVERYAKCLHLYWYECLNAPEFPKTRRKKNAFVKMLKEKFEAIDPSCVAEPNGVWNELLYELKHFD